MGTWLRNFLIVFFAGMVFLFVGLALEWPVGVVLAVSMGLILGAVVYMVGTVRRVRKGYPELMDMPEALQGTAEILTAGQLPMNLYMGEAEGYAPKAYQLELRVSVVGRPTYEVKHMTAAHPWAVAHLMPGNKIPVYLHPTKPKRMHLDFEQFRPGVGRAGTAETGDITIDGAAVDMSTGQITGVDPDALDAVKQATGMDLGDLINRSISAAGGIGSVPGIDIDLPEQVTVTNTRLELVESGVDGTAVVTRTRDLGMATPTGKVMEVSLEVTVAGEQPYRVVQRADLPTTPTDGETVKVKVDPNDGARVLIDGESGTSW